MTPYTGRGAAEILVSLLARVVRFLFSLRPRDDLAQWRSLLGQVIEVRWRDPSCDWPYFTLVAVEPEGLVLLRGADYPDGSAKHEGDAFWVHVGEVADVRGVR